MDILQYGWIVRIKKHVKLNISIELKHYALLFQLFYYCPSTLVSVENCIPAWVSRTLLLSPIDIHPDVHSQEAFGCSGSFCGPLLPGPSSHQTTNRRARVRLRLDHRTQIAHFVIILTDYTVNMAHVCVFLMRPIVLHPTILLSEHWNRYDVCTEVYRGIYKHQTWTCQYSKASAICY